MERGRVDIGWSVLMVLIVVLEYIEDLVGERLIFPIELSFLGDSSRRTGCKSVREERWEGA